MTNESILELTLGGFQVFAEPVTFPLGPITLIFGPNSAGKSAISDALQVLSRFAALFNEGASHDESEILQKAASLLANHWRLEPGDPPVRVPEVQLGIRIRVARNSWANDALAMTHLTETEYGVSEKFKSAFAAIGPWSASDELVDLDLQLRFSRGEESLFADEESVPSELAGFHLRIDLSLAGRPILQSERQGWMALQTAHPIFGGRLNMRAYKRLAARHPEHSSLKDGWLGFNRGMWLTSVGQAVGPLTLFCDDEASFAACGEFANLFNAIWLCSIRTVRRWTELTMVPASRSIPSLHELTYLKGSDGRNIEGNRFGIQIESRAEFDSLATCGLRAKLISAEDDVHPEPPEGDRTLEDVNRLLAEHMFQEKGYYVHAEINPLMAIRPNARLLPHATPGQPRFPDGYLVTLALADPDGRRFGFDEVGSGLGYVLPVLAALVSSRMTFIQQPELHLHPALQAELADALLERFGEARQHIVETHSEYFLLRLLRRVRQRLSHPLAGLDSNDLVVLYINPERDSTSTIVRLRISPDGEFIDRWPRGFFEERWKDLFDE